MKLSGGGGNRTIGRVFGGALSGQKTLLRAAISALESPLVSVAPRRSSGVGAHAAAHVSGVTRVALETFAYAHDDGSVEAVRTR